MKKVYALTKIKSREPHSRDVMELCAQDSHIAS